MLWKSTANLIFTLVFETEVKCLALDSGQLALMMESK